MTEHDEITIRLAEYTSLRAEILQLLVVMNQQIAVAAALGVAALGLMATSMWMLGLLLMIFAPVPLAFFILMLNFNTLDAARRVREIETDVNALAGKRLLVWETDHRLYKVSYLDRVKSVLRGSSDAG